jgi:hypothetical protein
LAPDPCPAPPPGAFDPLEERLPAGTQLVRIHAPAFAGEAFNPWTAPGLRPTRFAPFAGRSGDPVPTLYAALDFATALAESLFHDLPRFTAEVQVARSRLDELAVSRLEVRRELRLAALRGTGLRRLRVDWNRLIGSPPTCYPRTQAWARACHRHPRRFHGLLWHSRQRDGSPALLLFGDSPVAATALVSSEPSARLSNSPWRELVERECEAAGILLTQP